MTFDAIHMTLPITPTGQMRARACVRGKHASVYKAKKQEQREQTLAACLMRFVPRKPIEGPVLVYVNAYMPMPKSKTKAWKRDAMLGVVRPGKPDADNLAKHLLDVMTQLRFFGDDAQVAEIVVRKWYSPHPGWNVTVAPAEVKPLGFDGLHDEATA